MPPRTRLWRQNQARIHKARRYNRQGFDTWAEKDVMEVIPGYHHHCQVDHNGDRRFCHMCDTAEREMAAEFNKMKDAAWWLAQA